MVYLRDEKMLLRLDRARKLIDALAHTLEYEATKHASHNRVRVRVVTDELEESANEELEQACQCVLTNFQRRKLMRCWNSGELGHVRSRCRKPASRTKVTNNQGNKTGSTQMVKRQPVVKKPILSECVEVLISHNVVVFS